MDVPVSEFAPDQPPLGAGTTGRVENVLPNVAASYGPWPSLAAQGDALTARCRGAWSFRSKGAVIYNFAADATKIYKKNSSAWDDVSRTSGGAYAIATDDQADMCQFGDVVIYTNGTDANQTYTLDLSTDFEPMSGLGDTPPVARFCDTCLEFVVLGRLSGAQNKIAWSESGDPYGWTAGVSLSGTQEFPNGGRVMGVIGGQSITVFLESQIQAGTFVGTGDVFRFRPVSIDRGCAAEGSIAAWQNVIFFLAYDGFYMMAGDTIVPIGAQKVDRSFWEGSDGLPGVNTEYLYRISAVVDPVRKLYLVAYPSTSSADGTPDTILAYNFDTKRWSVGYVDLDILFRGRTGVSMTLEEYSVLYPDLDDADNPSMDSNLLSGSPKETLAAFDTSFKLAFFNGPNLAATVDTIEAQIFPGHRAKVRAVRPLTDGGTSTVKLIGRNRLQDSPTVGTQVSMNSSGRCPTPSGALWRYHRARIGQPAAATWTHIMGADLEVSDGPIL